MPTSEAPEQGGRVLDLTEYRDLLRSVPRPTDEQAQAFALFVSEAHSWYKHLPLLPPGTPFRFFVDPYAGFHQEIVKGQAVLVPSATHGFHYSSLPTRQYQTRFGHLAYACRAGWSVSLVFDDGSALKGPDPSGAGVFTPDGQFGGLPPEVVEAGTEYLTGVIHRRAAWNPQAWLDAAAGGTPSWTWRSAGGGEYSLADILDRCREVEAMPLSERPDVFAGQGGWVDPELLSLLATPRRQSLDRMVATMRRMLDLVYG